VRDRAGLNTTPGETQAAIMDIRIASPVAMKKALR